MNGYSKIPVKITRDDVISDMEFEIDTKGLDCIVRPIDTDMWVYLKSGERQARFPVKQGESLEFCGKLYYMTAMSGTIFCFMYQRL